MSKRVLSTALAAVLGVVAFAPQAASADTVTFNGKVLSSTCTVSNASGGNVAVTLPAVPVSSFTGAASTAGSTPFSLTLTGCPTTPSGVMVGAAFSGTNIDTTTGAIKNATGAGNSNVEVQMTKTDDTGINLNTNPNPVSATISPTGTASLDYKARYYQATATAVTPGLVNASVTYTLTYN
ncbi:type 1 fimbrial protein [Frateuria sp. MAH-13]|uniref:Type 1 fimbrial protein n=1 Tax=Frateuria flava TaxID=2821489 RepID=A0ABS4DMI4_9GAMM|nr:fimbrial protein [Frateuria flava]MBP1474261.1 type 1 fimbrial protein [Frateuria flava]